VSRWSPKHILRAVRRRVAGAGGVLDVTGPPPPPCVPEKAELKILFVCHGNVCRSPLAQDIVRRRLVDLDMVKRVFVDSAGIEAVAVGKRPDLRARDCARRHGGNLRDLRVRKFSCVDFAEFDLIIAMDERNRRDLLALAVTSHDRQRVRVLLDYVGGGEIADPAERGTLAFEEAYRSIVRGSEGLLRHLEHRLQPTSVEVK
jgi:protein-tyrosine phosphatase